MDKSGICTLVNRNSCVGDVPSITQGYVLNFSQSWHYKTSSTIRLITCHRIILDVTLIAW
jgi:hypothetical protein